MYRRRKRKFNINNEGLGFDYIGYYYEYYLKIIIVIFEGVRVFIFGFNQGLNLVNVGVGLVKGKVFFFKQRLIVNKNNSFMFFIIKQFYMEGILVFGQLFFFNISFFIVLNYGLYCIWL